LHNVSRWFFWKRTSLWNFWLWLLVLFFRLLACHVFVHGNCWRFFAFYFLSYTWLLWFLANYLTFLLIYIRFYALWRNLIWFLTFCFLYVTISPFWFCFFFDNHSARFLRSSFLAFSCLMALHWFFFLCLLYWFFNSWNDDRLSV
jgi:hypothetical protein